MQARESLSDPIAALLFSRLMVCMGLDSNVEISDVTAAVVWLLSDEARFVTGLELTVDAGETKK